MLTSIGWGDVSRQDLAAQSFGSLQEAAQMIIDRRTPASGWEPACVVAGPSPSWNPTSAEMLSGAAEVGYRARSETGWLV
jgi:hypothetical protein